MRPLRLSLSLSIPNSLVSLVRIVNCLTLHNSPDNYDFFDTDPLPDFVQDSNVVADIFPSIPAIDSQDLFSNADETPMLISSLSMDLDGYEVPYLLDDALVGTDSIGADVGIPSDTSFQLAEGTICPGENRQLWCCPDQNPLDLDTCVYYNGESFGICNAGNHYCCSTNDETKRPFDCEKKLYPSLFDKA